MKGTLICSALSGLDLQGHGKTLHELHQGLRDVVKLGLKGYESLLTMSLKTGHRVVGAPTVDAIDGWTEDAVIFEFQDGQESREEAKRTLAAEIIRHRRALRSHSRMLAQVTSKYLEAQDIAIKLKRIIEGTKDINSAGNLHFDMLQVPRTRDNLN